MKREFKFRAWVIRSDNKDSINTMRYEDNSTLFGWIRDGVTLELMQWTGLKDKNNEDLYEGDVLCWPEYEGTKNQSRWVVEWDNEKAEYTKWHPKNKAEKIGNIYENRNLLE